MSCNLLKVIQRATALSCQCILEIKKKKKKELEIIKQD